MSRRNKVATGILATALLITLKVTPLTNHLNGMDAVIGAMLAVIAVMFAE